MKEYIEKWFKESIINITEEDQLEAAGTGREIATKEDTKGKLLSK